MEYHHTQKGWFHRMFYAVVVGMAVLMWFVRHDTAAVAAIGGAAGVLFVVALAFHWMTVRDEGDSLVIRYGPLPLLGTRIRYAEITAVEPGQTSLIDGWGVHYIPWRGWTYNLWGFGCARLQLGNRVVRIGTDDVDNLVSFLRRKVRSPMA